MLFENYFFYQYTVDDCNNECHFNTSLKKTWITHWWDNRIFALILVIMGISIFLAPWCFMCKDKLQHVVLHFLMMLAKTLVYNENVLHIPKCSLQLHQAGGSLHYLAMVRIKFPFIWNSKLLETGLLVLVISIRNIFVRQKDALNSYKHIARALLGIGYATNASSNTL